MGSATSTHQDEWAMMNNIGGLAGVRQAAAAFASEVHPLLPGSGRVAALIATPVTHGVAGLGIFRFGDEAYSEQIISAGYANRLGSTSLGIKINLIQYHAAGFGYRNALSIGFGGVSEITPNIAVGAYIFNLNQPRISSGQNERLPARLAAGAGLKLTEGVRVNVEVEKDLPFPATFKAGMEYRAYSKFFLRTGFNLQPSSGAFGLGFKNARVRIDYATQFNSLTGIGHHVSFSYAFLKRTKG